MRGSTAASRSSSHAEPRTPPAQQGTVPLAIPTPLPGCAGGGGKRFLPATPAAARAAGIKGLPSEVLTAVAARLPDAADRAALACAFPAARAAAAAAATTLALPAAALAASPGGVELALRRHAGVERLAVFGELGAAGDPRRAAPLVRAATASIFSALPALRRLSRVDLGAAPPEFFEALPSPLLRALAAAAPHLESLEVSAHLWHAPARAAALRALARSPPAHAPCGSPAAPGLRLAAALLELALPAQCAREDLRVLGALPRLESLVVVGSLPREAAPQLAGLPRGLARLALGCAVLTDDEELGAALGVLCGLERLELEHLPSPSGALFLHMTGLTRLTHLELSRCGITAAGLAPLAASLAPLESLRLAGCPALHAPCRAALPREVARLARLETLHLDFTLHVRDVQVLVQLPSLSALAASQFHACVASHFAGRGFERLRRLALHVVRPGADTCVAAQVPQAADAGAAPPSPPPGRAGVSSADAAGDGAGATPPQDPRAPSALHSQLHAAIQDMLLQELEPQQQEQQQERQLLLSQLLDQLASQAAPQLEPHQPRMQVAAAPTVARVGLLVALCPALRQLSIGCGGPQVLRAIEGHATLHHIEMHGGAALPTHAPPSPHAIGGCEAAGAATAAFTAVLPPRGSAGAWEPLRRAPPALTRLALLDADALLGGAASPIAPLVALANGAAHLAVARGGGGGDGGSGGGVSELHLMRYSSLTDGGLAAAAPLMAGVRALVLDGCQNLTDAGLIWVAALPLLESLILSRCPLITDAGLARALAAAPALRRASLAGCGGTTAGGAAAAAGTAGAARGRRVEIDWARA